MSATAASGARLLLTGCTGFVGKVVLEELLRRRQELGIEAIYVLVRPRRNLSAAERFARWVAPSPCFRELEDGWQSYCRPVGGDITAEGLGLAPDDAARLQGELSHVIHCAASVRFDLPLEQATRINVTGALNILDFARGCTRLRRLVDVSTAYVTPHPGDEVPIRESLVELPFDAEETYASILAGTADEDTLLARSRHPNTYTLTKCLAERLLAQRAAEVGTPLSLLRPSIVSACRRHPFPGWIDSHAAYAAFISLLGAGYLRAVRVDPQGSLDVVPCDDVAARIIACAFDPALQQPLVVRHAVSGRANSGTLGDLARWHEDYFQAHPHERRARWAYCGRSTAMFRLNEWLYHRVPLAAARTAARLRGRRQEAEKIDRLGKILNSLDHVFHHFATHSFDFRSSFPAPEDFELRAYIDTVSAGISRHLLKRDPRQATLQMHGTDAAWAFRQPDGGATVRVFAYFMRKVLRHAGTRITFDETSLQAALRGTRPEQALVLAPSHRSYMDFLVTSLLCFAHPGLGLRIPKVAATEDFARIPIVGRVLKAAGAFYIKRGKGTPDPALNQQLAELVREGHSLEFYPEGTRSRSRRFLPPKRGILRALQGTGQRVVVLPLAIGYDRIAEETGFLRELDGRARHKGGLRPLTQWLGKLTTRRICLGRIHIRCGSPLVLEPATDIRVLSRALVAELQRNMVTTLFHLHVFCRAHPELGIDPEGLRTLITARGGTVLDSPLDDSTEVPELVARTFETHWMHLFYAEALARYAGNEVVMAHVRRNGFWYPPRPETDDPRVDALLDALFAPICRDFARVAAEVESFPDDGRTLRETVRRLPGAFLRDVEDALEELVDAAILERVGHKFRRAAEGTVPAMSERWVWTGAA